MPPLLPAYESDSSDILQAEQSLSFRSSGRSTPSTSTVPLSENPPDVVPSRKQKRKRAASSESLASSASSPIGLEPSADLVEVTEKQHALSSFINIQPPHLLHPKTLYAGHEPPLPRSKERLVLKEILEAEVDKSDMSNGDFISIDLEDFSIYRPHQVFSGRSNRILNSELSEKARSNELVSLHELNSRNSDSFLLDGTLCFGHNGGNRRYVQQVSFETLSIGAYEDITLHTVGPHIWLQSVAGQGSNIWYRLRSPAREYLRYHEPFLWLADLAKYVVDFLHTRSNVTLGYFRSGFDEWLRTVHGSHQSFLSWQSKYSHTDFRHTVAAHAAFLYNQAGQLGSQYINHPLWGETDPNALTAIPRRPEERADPRTVVTSYVYECFKHMPWAKFLESVSLGKEQEQNQSDKTRSHKFDGSTTILARDHQNYYAASQHARMSSSKGEVGTGDIVAIRSDTNTKWKTKDEYWFAYVQDRKPAKGGHQLSLIWIYRPADTACQDMRYPYTNELFLSDHCNCGDGPVYTSDVVRKVRVALFGLPDTTDTEFFIRQTYSSAESYWSSLQPSDFCCRCTEDDFPSGSEYAVGDTLLVRASSPNESLEPVVLVEKAPDGDHQKVRVRRLLRKREDFGDHTAEPNELVYTTRVDICNVSLIARRCHVRLYTPDDRRLRRIPAPYNRKGTGDCYYILWKQNGSEGLDAIQMKQGFDPLDPPMGAPMRGLDIFCGGGSFGRGLEEGGAVKMDWAVDILNEAIHTYHANTQGSTKLYNGSVNDYLFKAMNGRQTQGIARLGEVAVICAGSPCQGFSIANRLYANYRSLLNISLVASVVAFVDFYRPKYVIMENVLGMANAGPKRAGQNNVFAQVLCALVGLGYQVRPMMVDSWNFGAPQSRSRLFITAAAPGLAPFTRPPPSHSHPDGVIGRSLGKAANGLPFGAREWAPTPFEYVSVGEATKDLPENPDGRTTCIPCPDHRVTRSFSILDNIRLSCIPRFPPGMTFVKSVRLGWQSAPQVTAWHWDSDLRSNSKSRAWQRAKSNALLPTVTTENAPNEALTGSALHWDAHRPLTVMEARRAQGYPDEEIIIGTPSMQWKIVGNSVTRQVAIAFGTSLREAWLANGPSCNDVQEGSSVEVGTTKEADADLVEPGMPEATVGIGQFPVDGSKPVPLSNNREKSVDSELHTSKRAKHRPSDCEGESVSALKTRKLSASTPPAPDFTATSAAHNIGGSQNGAHGRTIVGRVDFLTSDDTSTPGVKMFVLNHPKGILISE
ncbi:MAG: hypothetical protein Q9225_001651 [Loekoesia sp. 1 TL-2023]